MLPVLGSRSAFIEITNPVHGGPGWEFGTCLWSPQRDKGGGLAWRLMETVKDGDLIIHLLKTEGGYKWVGVSLAQTKLFLVQDEPNIPGDWSGMSPYQRINISQFLEIPTPFPIIDFFTKYNQDLDAILSMKYKDLFYMKVKNTSFRVQQRYFAKVPQELYALFNGLSNELDFNYVPTSFETQNVTKNEPAYPAYPQPARVETYVNRIIRDTALVREVKQLYGWACNICGSRIQLSNGEYYAEGAHIVPLGGNYNGPDIRENILILCPTHHTEFDFGSLSINPDTLQIVHIDTANEYHDKKISYERRDISKENLRFHYEKIFRKVILMKPISDKLNPN